MRMHRQTEGVKDQGGMHPWQAGNFEAHTRQLSSAINNFKCTLVLFCVLPSFCYVVLHNMKLKNKKRMRKDSEAMAKNVIPVMAR